MLIDVNNDQLNFNKICNSKVRFQLAYIFVLKVHIKKSKVELNMKKIRNFSFLSKQRTGSKISLKIRLLCSEKKVSSISFIDKLQYCLATKMNQVFFVCQDHMKNSFVEMVLIHPHIRVSHFSKYYILKKATKWHKV